MQIARNFIKKYPANNNNNPSLEDDEDKSFITNDIGGPVNKIWEQELCIALFDYPLKEYYFDVYKLIVDVIKVYLIMID